MPTKAKASSSKLPPEVAELHRKVNSKIDAIIGSIKDIYLNGGTLTIGPDSCISGIISASGVEDPQRQEDWSLRALAIAMAPRCKWDYAMFCKYRQQDGSCSYKSGA